MKLLNVIAFVAGLLLLFCYLVYRFVYTPCFCDYLLAEKCRFRLQNTEPLKIGTDVTYTISVAKKSKIIIPLKINPNL